MSDRPQPGPQDARDGIPVWVFVVTVAAVAIIAGSAVWLMTRPRPVEPTASITPTTTVAPTATVETTLPVVTTTTPTPTTTPVPATVREPALIKSISGSSSKGYRITVDYIQILTGKAAADAATAAGDESPPPNDYYIVNASKTLRTFSLSKTASITVVEWPGAEATARHKLTVGQFMAIMPSADPKSQWARGRYYVTVKAGKTVTKVAQIFFP